MELKPELLKGIYGMGFRQPSKIQGYSIPRILKQPDHHMVAQAQSGTGKTASFSVSMLMKVDSSLKYPQAICVLPTLELAHQVFTVVKGLAAHMDIGILSVIKDEQYSVPVTSQIIVGTPGSLMECLTKKKAFDPTKIVVFVLDEADQLISSDPRNQLAKDTAALRNFFKNKELQVLCFSATFPDRVSAFVKAIVRGKTTYLTLKRTERTVRTITQLYIDCPGGFNSKIGVLKSIYDNLAIEQSMIFVHSRKTADSLGQAMRKAGFTVSVTSGSVAASERKTIFDNFVKGVTKVLISTNMMARGIDVRSVSLIINFDLPTCPKPGAPSGPGSPQFADVDTYLHRVGRTGRFGDEGLALNFVSTPTDRKHLKIFEQQQGTIIKPWPADKIPELQPTLDKIKANNAAVRAQAS